MQRIPALQQLSGRWRLNVNITTGEIITTTAIIAITTIIMGVWRWGEAVHRNFWFGFLTRTCLFRPRSSFAHSHNTSKISLFYQPMHIKPLQVSCCCCFQALLFWPMSLFFLTLPCLNVPFLCCTDTDPCFRTDYLQPCHRILVGPRTLNHVPKSRTQ